MSKSRALGVLKALRGQRSTRVGTYEYFFNGVKWRWRLRAANGEIIAHGGEGYASKQQVLNAIDRVIDYSATVPEWRPDRLINKANPKRAEILRGCGTQIVEVEK